MICEECGNQGFKKIINSSGFEEYVICDCHRATLNNRILQNRLIESNIPKHFWNYELDWYRDTFKASSLSSERDLLFKFIEEPSLFKGSQQSLWICSKNEKSYKTSLAIQLGKSLLSNPTITHKVKFFQFRKLMELFLDFDHKKSIINSYLSSHFIIIDDMFDLTRATVKDYQAVNLYGFIEDAINANIMFICTSNDTIDSFTSNKFFAQTAQLLKQESFQVLLQGPKGVI